MSWAKKILEQKLQRADIVFDGDRPWDVTVHDKRVYGRVLRSGRLALGETYMEGWWSTKDLSGVFERVLRSYDEVALPSLSTKFLRLQSSLQNLQSKARAFMVGETHYDFGNELYEPMLGESMVYTCADFTDLDEHELTAAQTQKLDVVCQKLNLKPGQRFLDIGCGWGSLLEHAARHYGVVGVGLTVSKEQAAYASNRLKGLPCTIEVVDYRVYQPDELFDAAASIEMIEAVGQKNFRTYFQMVHDVLKPGGQFFLQAIGDVRRTPEADPWLNRYIFPNGILPSLAQIERASNGLLAFEWFEDIGRDYEPTLKAWWRNLDAIYPTLQAADPAKYTPVVRRMFEYYLLSCAALAKTRGMYDWQILFSKHS